MIPRDYQLRAYEALLDSLCRGNNPAAAVATGGGKSLLISMLVDRFRSRGGKSLVLTNSKELVVQNMISLRKYAGLEGVGVYCSGLGHSAVGTSSTYGTIQTLYRNLDKLPSDLDAIIVDEVQNVAHKGSEAKMYNTLMNHFPNARKIGLSATPYRLDKGLVYEGEGCHFDDLAIEITVKELIELGYLTPLKGIAAAVQLNLEGVHRSNGDFDTKEVDERMTEAWLREVLANVNRLATGRKTILIFTPTVRTAELVAKLAVEIGISAEYVHGGDSEREDRLKRWEAGEFTIMANCQILTVGYDNPAIDCIVDCAPTESLGKHIQKLGRGVRNYPGKTDCLVIDVAGNLSRLGGISSEADFVQERADGSLVKGKIRKPKAPKPRGVKHGDLITDLDPMLASPSGMEGLVRNIVYIVINSKSIAGKQLLMVAYECQIEGGALVSANQFICVEYDGWARKKAEEWFALRGVQAPYSAERAKVMCWGLPEPRTLTIRKKGKYAEVLKEHF